MRHDTARQAIAAAKADYAAGKHDTSHSVGWTGVSYVAHVDGVYRHERGDSGGTRGIRVPNRRIYSA
jgi:hypothetical protein